MNYTRATTAALAAVLLLGQAQSALAEPTFNDGVIFCKGTVTPNGEGGNDIYLSVTIPATEGATDELGNPTTIWNVGSVMAGGVYDSFYNGGPGHFRVQNTGNMPAYVYVSTGYGWPKFQAEQNLDEFYYFDSARRLGLNSREDYSVEDTAFYPVALPKFLPFGYEDAERTYALAVSTEVTGVVPKWRPLSWFDYGGEYVNGAEAISFEPEYRRYRFSRDTYYNEQNEVTAYLCYMPIGETQLFDLKLWAPRYTYNARNFWFPIRIEASAVKFWDHEQ